MGLVSLLARAVWEATGVRSPAAQLPIKDSNPSICSGTESSAIQAGLSVAGVLL
jgi:hypothetical protein